MHRQGNEFSLTYLYLTHQFYTLLGRHMERKLSEIGKLTFSQYWVLVCFVDCKDEDKPTASNIAKRMYMSEATLSGHIDRMIRQKLIIKKQDKDNKKKYIINLTDKGRKELDEARKTIHRELGKIFQEVKKEEEGRTIKVMQKLLKNIIHLQ